MALLLYFHKSDIHERYNRKIILTHLAVSARNSGTLSVLLMDQRMYLNLRDAVGRTPLALAAHWHEKDLVELILRRSRTVVHESEDMSPIIFIAQHGEREITSAVINNCDDINSHWSGDRRSIMHWSVIQA